MNDMTLSIEVDGECISVCTLADFIDTNEALDAETVAAVRSLAVGATYGGGGGAGAEWSVTRLA